MMKIFTVFFRPLKALLSVCILLSSAQLLWSQNIIGAQTGNPTAILDLRSADKGLLIPRLTSDERSAITNPAPGLMIFNTTLNCLEINLGGSGSPDWVCMLVGGQLASLDCGAASITGSLTEGEMASGFSFSVPYSGGNGGFHGGQTVASTGSTGLTATLMPGSLAVGSGSLTYTVTGTPVDAGTASFALAIGGQSCNLNATVNLPVGVVGGLNCAGATVTGTLTANAAASGLSASVAYTGGNGGPYSGQTVASTGVTGLTATLTAGSFASGSGSLTYTITGTPASSGTASFALNIGGQSCALQLTVASSCGAFVAAGVWKEFMCHNLGANTSADPFTPSWELNGNYYQWGRNPTCFGRDGTDAANPCSSPVYGAAGPWGSTTANDNAGAITGWSTTTAANGDWTDASKTSNDPCPAGFRVPTRTQLEALEDNVLNTRTLVGAWTNSTTNYSSGSRFGQALFLPTAGLRIADGSLANRGSNGYYWSSTVSSANALILVFNSSGIVMSTGNRPVGASLRCIAQ